MSAPTLRHLGQPGPVGNLGGLGHIVHLGHLAYKRGRMVSPVGQFDVLGSQGFSDATEARAVAINGES